MAPGPLQMPHSSRPHTSSTSSQMPSASSSAAQSPPQTPRASSWLPSQSQSPSGCPHIHTRRWRQGRCRCRTRRVLHTWIDVVTNAIGIFVGRAVTAADTEGVKLVAVAVAVAFWDVRTSALVDGARPLQMLHSSSSPTHGSTLSQMPSASSSAAQSPPQTPRASSWLPSQSQRLLGCQHIRTRRWRQGRCRCRTRRVLNTWIDVVTNAIGIFVGRAVTAADTEGVKLVAVAVAVAFGDVRTSALVDGARAVADAALVEFSNTWIDVVWQMPSASSSAAQSPPQTPRASSWLPSQSQSPSGMSAHRTRRWRQAVADAALVEFSNTWIDVVTNAIGIFVGRAVTAADTEGASWLPSQSQSPSGMSAHPHS